MNYKITELKQIGKSEKYKLFLDYSYRCDVQLETIYKHKLKIGIVLSEQELDTILFDDKKLTCYSASLKFVSKSLKTEKQVREYLKKHEYPFQLIEDAIQKLFEYKYIDDCAYAQSYYNTYKNLKGLKLIKNELKNKGISDEVIDDVFLEISDNYENITKIIEKKLKNSKKTLDLKQKEKLIRFLISRGFDYSDIKKALSKYDFRNEIEEDF